MRNVAALLRDRRLGLRSPAHLRWHYKVLDIFRAWRGKAEATRVIAWLVSAHSIDH